MEVPARMSKREDVCRDETYFLLRPKGAKIKPGPRTPEEGGEKIGSLEKTMMVRIPVVAFPLLTFPLATFPLTSLLHSFS